MGYKCWNVHQNPQTHTQKREFSLKNWTRILDEWLPKLSTEFVPMCKNEIFYQNRSENVLVVPTKVETGSFGYEWLAKPSIRSKSICKMTPLCPKIKQTPKVKPTERRTTYLMSCFLWSGLFGSDLSADYMGNFGDPWLLTWRPWWLLTRKTKGQFWNNLSKQ